MKTEPIFELNIALIPAADVAEASIATSQKLSKNYPTLVQLNDANAKLALTPHLTLYQTAVPARRLNQLLDELSEVASQLGVPTTNAVQYAYNSDEASFEVRYEVSDLLVLWQKHVIEHANPLRDGHLLERDPAGHEVKVLLNDKGLLGDNIRQTGFGEVGDPRQGGLFRPHVTLNWFALGTSVDENDSDLPDLATLSGQFPSLGIYLMGPYGTCPQRLAQYPASTVA